MSMFEFIIPIYKSAPFLGETLKSLQAQNDSNFRIQIRSVAFPNIREHLSIPDSIEIQLNSQGRGIGSDWEDALHLAHGPYATLAHSDDVYKPDYARKVREAFSRWPEAGIAFTLNDYIPPTAKLKTLLWIKRFLNPRGFARGATLISGERMFRALRYGGFIPCPTVSFHLPIVREALKSQPLFDPNLKVTVDWNAWVTLAQRGVSFIYIPEPLVSIRVHQEATTQNTMHDGQRSREEVYVLEKLWGPSRGRLLSKAFILGQKLQSIRPKP